MKTLAAVLVETGRPLQLVELEIPVLEPGQTLIEITMSGVCHTQLLEMRGHRGPDKFLPHCLGHEGVGVVRDVGIGVSKVKPGDRVILSWMKGSGQDVPSTVYDWNGRGVNAGAITTFARHAVISENRLMPLPNDLPDVLAALLGCAIPTGMGSVINTAEFKAGQSCVVFGVGGIGLCAIAAAASLKAAVVVAVDLLESKKPHALAAGATHFVHAPSRDVVSALNAIVPKGFDVAIEATGQPIVMKQALSCVRAQGGRAVVVGNARYGTVLELDPLEFNRGKRLLGTWGGDNHPDQHFPAYARIANAAQNRLRPLTANVYTLENVNVALDDLGMGKALRPLLRMA